jgi:hypothetical protein
VATVQIIAAKECAVAALLSKPVSAFFLGRYANPILGLSLLDKVLQPDYLSSTLGQRVLILEF